MIIEKKADRFSSLGMAFFIGWIACSAYYAIPTLWQKQNELHAVQTKVVPQLKAKVAEQGCTIGKVTGVAVAAIEANESAGVTGGPTYQDIKPCPTVKPVIPAAKQ